MALIVYSLCVFTLLLLLALAVPHGITRVSLIREDKSNDMTLAPCSEQEICAVEVVTNHMSYGQRMKWNLTDGNQHQFFCKQMVDIWRYCVKLCHKKYLTRNSQFQYLT